MLYFTVMPDFMERYTQYSLDRARADGRSEAELARMRAEAAKFAVSYRNPLFNSAVTFLEPLPVGVLVTLVSAGVLRRRRRDDAPSRAVA